MAVAADIMTKDVVTVSPDTLLHEVAELLESKRYGSLPVVTQDRHVLGLVREEDLVARAAEVHLPRHINFLGGIIYFENPQRFEEEAEKILAMTARDIMSEYPPTTDPDTPVENIATRLLQEDLRRILVLDDLGRLVGIITRADIVRMLTTEGKLPEGEEHT